MLFTNNPRNWVAFLERVEYNQKAMKIKRERKAMMQFPNDKLVRFISIGNSHTSNSTNVLFDVFRAEMPQQKVLVGNMYHSGCSVEQQIEFGKKNAVEYWYMKNADGNWDINKEATLTDGLKDQPWDIVILHEMNVNYMDDGNFDNDNLDVLKAFVKDNVSTDPVFLWNMGWANPTDEELILTMKAATNEEVYQNWRNMYVEGANLNYETMYQKLVKATTDKVLPGHEFKNLIPTGAAFYYAREKMGLTDKELYVDYTHASDFGCLLAAYVWYAVLTGQKEIIAVHLDKIPAALRHISTRPQGDMIITEDMKNVIVRSVNYALNNNPFNQ